MAMMTLIMVGQQQSLKNQFIGLLKRYFVYDVLRVWFTAILRMENLHIMKVFEIAGDYRV